MILSLCVKLRVKYRKNRAGEASPSLQPCPFVTLERSDRVQGKSSSTPTAGARRPATPRLALGFAAW